MEDPKAKEPETSERARAIEAAEAESRAERKALVRGMVEKVAPRPDKIVAARAAKPTEAKPTESERKTAGAVDALPADTASPDATAKSGGWLMRIGWKRKGNDVAVPGSDQAGAAKGPAKPNEAQTKGAASRRKAASSEEATAARRNPFRALVQTVLGESTRTDSTGSTVVVPPPETDWRWHVQRFFRSQRRIMVYGRSGLLLFLLVSTAWMSLYSATGFNLLDVLEPADPEDPVTNYDLPFFIVESGSMMHPNADYGRLGTIDPGDLMVVEKIRADDPIQTFYGKGDRHSFGGKGDVIVYLPEDPGLTDPPPIVHRAMAYIHRETVPIPNPIVGPSQPVVVQVPRFTVEEFGIVNAASINIPELGLENYQPDRSGYITQGDNPRTNYIADQALGVTVFPVREERIIGRVAYEAPFIGLAKIAITGQNPALISADDQWCSFLAGQAACDTWVIFLTGVVVLVGGPLAITVFIFTRRAYERRMDKIATRRRQDEEAAHLAAMRAGGDRDDDAPELPIHDAVDLLAGKVRVASAPIDRPRGDWRSGVGPSRARFSDDFVG